MANGSGDILVANAVGHGQQTHRYFEVTEEPRLEEMYMRDLKMIEDGLRKRLAELKSRVEQIDDDLREPGDDDSVEMASEASGDEVLETMGNLADREQAQIALALERIKRGKYGECQGCGESIKQARLDAVPYAVRCTQCVGD